MATGPDRVLRGAPPQQLTCRRWLRVGSERCDRAVLGALLPGVLETGFDGFLTEFEAVAPSHLRRAFRLALVAAGWVAPILIGGRRPSRC